MANAEPGKATAHMAKSQISKTNGRKKKKIKKFFKKLRFCKRTKKKEIIFRF